MQMRRGEIPQRKQLNIKGANSQVAREDGVRLKALQSKLNQVIDASELLRQYRNQLLVDITSEGLRIQVVDEQNRPMFDLGSAHLKPYARDILLALSPTLNEVENKISLTGHTDAKPYASGERGYSNWELSADRANASRQALVAGGIADGKIKRVVGMASAVPFDADDPFSPINRRIAIIVLTRQAEESLNKVSGSPAAAAVPDEVPKEVPVAPQP
jgi:chemotaxis protein MotB